MSKNDVKWFYHSPIGEIEIWARNADEVLYALFEHGFRNVDKTKIEQAPVHDEHEEVR